MSTQERPDETRVGRKVQPAPTQEPPSEMDGPALHRPLRIGPFRILEVLGEGGMGVVYLAEQQELVSRKVALKVMRSVLQGPESDYRFATERQALARLSHPCVARLFEAGTTAEGHPFFAMEYVDGQPLTVYCDRKRLGPRARLELFRAVCEGVQHAHQKGLLHRDLKPSNILVTEEGERVMPKIIDFGIATTLDDPRPDHIAGTPAYMSPEAFEAGRDLDTRSDVYSLGVVLHELLVGVRPLEASGSLTQVLRSEASQAGTRQRLSEKWTRLDPKSQRELAQARGLGPGPLGRLLRGDLDWILARALAPDREARYGSPAELAADLGRFLAGEAILARPSTALYRLVRSARRHRGLVASSLLLLLALMGGIWARTREAQRATREARRAEAEAERARQEAARADLASRRAEDEAARAREQAEEARRQAARAEAQTRLAERTRAAASLEAATATEVAEFMKGLFKVSTPSESLGSTITAKEVLDKGAARIEKDLATQPLVQARLMRAMGGSYVELGLYKQGEPLLQKALELLRGLKERNRQEEAYALNDLAALTYHRGDFASSERHYREALALKRALPKPDMKDLVQSLTYLANPLIQLKRYDEAETLLLEARQLQSRLPEDLSAQANIVNSLGALYYYQKKPDQALGALQEAHELRKKLHGERHPGLIPSLGNLDQMARAAGRLNEAEAYRRKALEFALAFMGEKHPETAFHYFELCLILARKSDWAGVADCSRKSWEIRKEALGPRHATTCRSQQGLGAALVRLERWDEADPILRDYLAIQTQEKRQDLLDYRYALMDLAKTRKALKDLPGARAAYTELLPLLRPREKAEVKALLDCLRGLYQVGLELQDPPAAEVAMAEFIQVAARQNVKDDPALALARGLRGDLLTTLGRHDEAEAHLKAGLEVLARTKGDGEAGTQKLLKALVRLYQATGKPEAARAYEARIQAEAPPPPGR